MKLIDADRLARWAKNMSGNTGAITFDDLNQYLIEAGNHSECNHKRMVASCEEIKWGEGDSIILLIYDRNRVLQLDTETFRACAAPLFEQKADA